MTSFDPQKSFFRPVCNTDEIDRIFNVKDGRDYLLKLRAETIVDHMRLLRVYRNKALINEKTWSLEKSFDASHYGSYLASLTSEKRKKCEKVVCGDMFSNDPNGRIFQTPYGPIITISEALRFFLKFAHLALLEFDCDVPLYVRINALRIAIRVMLRKEAMDFLMDPRGRVPVSVGKAMHAPIAMEMQFIAGHEFAHYLLGHLDENKIIRQQIYSVIDNEKENIALIYSYAQQQELAADLNAVELVNDSETHRLQILNGGLLWFACLSLYEAVSGALCLQNPCFPSSHPSAEDRFNNLLMKSTKPATYNSARWYSMQEDIKTFKTALLRDVEMNIELYEVYGSCYLDKPDSEWRGKKLIDRVDYY